jgi:hypothetical protein
MSSESQSSATSDSFSIRLPGFALGVRTRLCDREEDPRIGSGSSSSSTYNEHKTWLIAAFDAIGSAACTLGVTMTMYTESIYALEKQHVASAFRSWFLMPDEKFGAMRLYASDSSSWQWETVAP